MRKSERKRRRQAPRAALSLPAVGQGIALPGGDGLEVAFEDRHWSILVRRVDLRPDLVFACYDGKPVSAQDLIGFLPNWSSLKWIRVANSSDSYSESFGLDREYLVSVKAMPQWRGDHAEVVAAFLDFLRNA